MSFSQGELVWVELNPALGQETRSRHLCLVLNRSHSNSTVRLVAPMLRWKEYHAKNSAFYVKITQNSSNNLDEDRTPDVSQIRAVDLNEPGRVDLSRKPKKGQIDPSEMNSVRKAINLYLS